MDRSRFKRRDSSQWMPQQPVRPARQLAIPVQQTPPIPVIPPEITPEPIVSPIIIVQPPITVAPEAVPQIVTPVVEPIQPIIRTFEVPVQQLVEPKEHRHRKSLITAGVVSFALLLIGGFALYGFGSLTKADHPVFYGQASIFTPSVPTTFTPVIPDNKPQFAEREGITHDASAGTYGFIDSLDGTSISVSEHDEVSGYTSTEAAEVIDEADSSNRAVAISTNFGTAYVLTASSAKLQTVVVVVKGILVTIQSVAPHPNADWVAYINTYE